MNAAQYRFLSLLFEFDEHGGGQGDGIRSFAHWLNWKVGIGMMTRAGNSIKSVHDTKKIAPPHSLI